jgi:5'-methylthioadenosine phosphorylase
MATNSVEAEIGIIGGSGLYDFPGLGNVSEFRLSTPFGNPSDVVTVGDLNGRRVAFLARHGRHHQHSPSSLPVAANIYALKYLGVREVISVSAVGSLREHLRPGELVVPDQLVDFTRGRRSTFFDRGLVAHLPFAEPFCPRLREQVLASVGSVADVTSHDSGTYLCIEGPQFSTRAEAGVNRALGMDVIGMTAAPEAKLAREAGLCLATIALVTDYDCWRENEQPVTAAMVAEVMRRNVAAVRKAILHFTRSPRGERTCGCQDALAHAIMSNAASMSDGDRDRLDLLAGPYLS